jgi:hypothetical protein
MDSYDVKSVTRRGSRSSSLEESIRLMANCMTGEGFNLEDLQVLIINNKLPAELRPLTWKIFFGILNRKNNFWQWYNAIKTERERFENLSQSKEVELFTKVIRREADISTVKDNTYFNNYQTVVNELEKLKKKYDLFKSEIIAESVLRIFLIAKTQYSIDSVEKVFHIIAGLVYSLYPSILHFSKNFVEINEDNLDATTFFYYLNNEEFFDADVYMLVNKILDDGSFSKYFFHSHLQTQQLISKNIEEMENLLPGNPNFKYKELNRIERICYQYLQVTNKELFKHFLTNNISLYDDVNELFGYLLTKTICLSNLTYLWDNIFLYSSPEYTLFSFLEFVIVVIIDRISLNLKSLKEQDDVHKIISNYPEEELDCMEIVTKALKIQDIYYEILENNRNNKD